MLKTSLLLSAGMVLGAVALPSQADVVDLGSQSGNTITDEVLSFGWIRNDGANAPNAIGAGETSFVGTTGTSDFRGHVTFDLSGFSVGDTVNSATVMLFVDPQANAPAVGEFNANGDVGDATAVAFNITELVDVTGFGSGGTIDVGGLPTSHNNLVGGYGAVLDTIVLDLDNIANNAQVDLDVTAEIQAAIDNGAAKISFGLTAPDTIAIGARNFFAFQGPVSIAGDGATGPNLNVDFTPVPEPGSLALLGLGGLLIARRRRA